MPTPRDSAAASVVPRAATLIHQPTARELRGPMLRRLLWAGLRRALPGFKQPVTCLRQSPLPDDVRIEKPGPEVPPELARFSGAWNGAWLDLLGRPQLCHTLVVERVYRLGFADVVYSYGVSAAWGLSEPGWYRITAQINDGLLYFRQRFGTQYVAYAMQDSFVMGSIEGQGQSLLASVSLSDVGTNATVIPPPKPGEPRTQLTLANLFTAGGPLDLLDYAYFLPIGEAKPAEFRMEGRLLLGPFRMMNSVRGCPGTGIDVPELLLEFVCSDDEIIPIEQDIMSLPTKDRLDRIILSPGRIWSEPDDGPWSRASFPYVLTNSLSNEAHNGVATFLFNDVGISFVRLQGTQETNPWRQVDLVAQAPASYQRASVQGADHARAIRRAELEARWPLRPWSEIFPEDPDKAAAAFNQSEDVTAVSVSGLMVDRRLYLNDCATRSGPFPFPAEMRAAAFSVSKSIGGASILCWLAQEYGDGVFDQLLVSYLTPNQPLGIGWEGATFGSLLDMASALGDLSASVPPNRPFADEGQPRMEEWSLQPSAAEKIATAFGYGSFPWPAERVFRYNSALIFMMAAGLDALLKRHAGTTANLWDRFTEAVLNPLGIPMLPMMHTDEPDGSRGIPLLATGAYPTFEQTAKIAQLFIDNGAFRGRQLLSGTKVRRALDWTGSIEPGLPTQPDMNLLNGSYKSSFWRSPFRTGSNVVTVINMEGYGGNAVSLLPNGIACIRFTDGLTYSTTDMVAVAETLRPFESGAPGLRRATQPDGRPLTEVELRKILEGNTIRSNAGDWVCCFAPGGLLYLGRVYQDTIVGRWEIVDDRTLVRHDVPVPVGEGTRYLVYSTDRGIVLVDQVTDQLTSVVVQAEFGGWHDEQG
jgi:hypothetical protein